jgi:hypothetical protein
MTDSANLYDVIVVGAGYELLKVGRNVLIPEIPDHVGS